MLTAGIRAFSSVGRASPLQGEGQKFESSNAHHKKDSNNKLLSFLFYACFCFFSAFTLSCRKQTNGNIRITATAKYLKVST